MLKCFGQTLRGRTQYLLGHIMAMTLSIIGALSPSIILAESELQLDDPIFSVPAIESQKSPDFLAISQRLGHLKVFRANFEQIKTIKPLQRPLHSVGKMIVSKEDGLYWHLSEPFVSTLIVTEKTILVLGDDGSRQELRVKDNPVIHSISQIFLSFFTGDIDVLRKHFSVHFSGDQEGWTMGLAPRDSTIKRVIHHVVLQGALAITHLTIKDQNKDETELIIKDLILEPAFLTAKERNLFKP